MLIKLKNHREAKVKFDELDDELCIVGNILYREALQEIGSLSNALAVTSGESYSDKYEQYVFHIIECKECQEKLDIDSKNLELLKDIYIRNVPLEPCES